MALGEWHSFFRDERATIKQKATYEPKYFVDEDYKNLAVLC